MIGQEMRQQAALAGGALPPPPAPPCKRPGCCAPGTPQQVAAVHAERKIAQGNRDAALAAVERQDVVTELGQYLFDQIKAYPQLAETIACSLISQLVRVGKRPDMPGAVRVLIDTTGDVHAAMTPADPPSPPASTPPAAVHSPRRRRWWSNSRLAGSVALASTAAYAWTQWVQR